MTEQVVQTAQRRGVALTLCGEAAADPTIVPFLLGIGVTELSLSPFFAARVRRAIRDLTLDRAQSRAKGALGKRNAAEVRRLLAGRDGTPARQILKVVQDVTVHALVPPTSTPGFAAGIPPCLHAVQVQLPSARMSRTAS